MSRADAYYKREREVFADAFTTPCTPEEARLAIVKFGLRHGKPIGVRFTRGRRHHFYSVAGYIRLNVEDLTLGVVAHEYAHALHHYMDRMTATTMQWHGEKHWAIMQGLIVEMRERGWLTGNLTAELARRNEVKEIRAARRAVREASRNPRMEKIERRRQQIARLERKAKALATRIKTAKRSLAALERAAAKVQT